MFRIERSRGEASTPARLLTDLARSPLHLSRDVQRCVEGEDVRVRQVSEVHCIGQSVLFSPALVKVLGIDADRDPGRQFLVWAPS